MRDIMTWSSTNSSDTRCLFLENKISVISSFCHLVIIELKYTPKSVGEKGTPWHNSLPILVSFYNWELSFIIILYCEFMSNIAFKNVSETVPVFKLSNEVSLCTRSNAFS